MNSKINLSNLTYRKLKITDYHQFRRLFYSCFKKKSVLIFLNGDILMINFLFVLVLLKTLI